MTHRHARQSLLFTELDQLHAHAEKYHLHVKFEFESDDVLLARMHNQLIAKLNHESIEWLVGQPKTHIIKGPNLTQFDFLFDHVDLLDQLAASKDVKEINVRTISITFIYKEDYLITYLDDEGSALIIKREESDDAKLLFIREPKISEVFEILDKNIKKF